MEIFTPRNPPIAAPAPAPIEIAVSGPSLADNRAFAEKNGFPFRLLSDVDRKVGELYETKREDNHPEYARRLTYLIDPEGRIAKAYKVTDIAAHPGQVLEDFRRLTAGAKA